MKASEAVPTLPAVSVSLATIVCVPCASELGTKLHVPAPFAVAVPITLVPSFRVTTAPGSPPPVSVPDDVMRSVEDLPVSVPSASVTAGARLS